MWRCGWKCGWWCGWKYVCGCVCGVWVNYNCNYHNFLCVWVCVVVWVLLVWVPGQQLLYSLQISVFLARYFQHFPWLSIVCHPEAQLPLSAVGSSPAATTNGPLLEFVLSWALESTPFTGYARCFSESDLKYKPCFFHLLVSLLWPLL